jgi:hypothetical protein
MRNGGNRSDLWLTIASVASVVLTMVAISFSYFTFSRFAEFLFNADAIQTPAVFADVFGRGGSFFDWSIAPAPAIVPEYGMFAIAYVVGVNYTGRVLAYALIQVVTFWAALYGVSWAAGLRRPLVTASLIVSVFGLFSMLRVPNYTQLIQSAFHFGGFILQLVALALILLLWRRRGSRLALWVGIAAIALIGSLNDALFVVQLAAPVCVIVGVGVLARRIPWRSGISFAAMLGLASIAGWRLYSRVVPNPASSWARADLDGASSDLDSLLSVWGAALARSPIAALLVSAAVLLGLAGAYLLITRRNWAWMRGTILQTLAVFGLLSGTLPLVAAFISNAGTSPRYALPLFYWACILGAMLLTQMSWRRALTVATAVACVASLTSAGLAIRDVSRLGLKDSYYSATVSCLDEAARKHGVSHAIGTYWVAKPTQELSRSGLTVTVVTEKLRPRNWISTSANRYDAYDAFIDTKPKSTDSIRRALKQKFGKPVIVVTCPKATMSIWPAGSIVLPTE